MSAADTSPPPMATEAASPGEPSPSGSEPAELICSAKGCVRHATSALRWNNPKIHPADRRKTWLACDQHQASLGEFLSARSFLREVEPI